MNRYNHRNKIGVYVIAIFTALFYSSPCKSQYDKHDTYIDGLAKVCKNNLYGFINEEGKEIIPVVYTATGDIFYDGLVWVWEDTPDGEAWGYLDKSGDIAIPLTFGCASNFYDGVALVCAAKTFEQGLIDTLGNIVIPLVYEQAYRIYGEDMVVVKNNKSKWGILNLKNEELIPFIYDDINKYGDGLIAVSKDNKWGFISIKGGELIVPFNYDDVIFGFDNGFAFVVIDDTNYCIDKKGNLYECVKGKTSNGKYKIRCGKRL